VADRADALVAILDRAADPPERSSIDRDDLYALLERAFPGRSELHRDLEVLVLEQVGEVAGAGGYALRIGDWRLDVPTRALQTAIASAMLAGTIHVAGVTSIPVTVLAVVLPFVVDIERIEVRTRDRMVMAALREQELTGREAVDALYERLPDDVRGQLTRFEFADTFDRLTAAGMLSRARLSRSDVTAADVQVIAAEIHALTVRQQDHT
jgi:hypothetical protein